jgi:hypothetical protein
VELAGREVGHFVAEDFLEKSVGGGFSFEVRRDADEALVGRSTFVRQSRTPAWLAHEEEQHPIHTETTG